MTDVTPPPLPPTPALDYELQPEVVSRKRYRRMLWLTGLGWLLVAAVLFGPFAWRSLQRAIRVTTAPRAVPAPPPPAMKATVGNTVRVVDANDRESRASRIEELLENERSADLVAYEEDPAAARVLLDNRSSYSEYSAWGTTGVSPPPGYQSPAFIVARDINNDGRLGVLNNSEKVELFRGGLKSPAGNERLVRMVLQLRYESHGSRQIPGKPTPERVLVIKRQLQFEIHRHDKSNDYLSWVRAGQSLRLTQGDGDQIPIEWIDGVLRANRDPKANLRFYAGQIDPKDPSHFTIDYQIDGKRETIDGWLTDDDFLRIKPRGGTVEGGNSKLGP